MKPLGALGYLKNNIKKIFPQFICILISVYFVYLISALFYSALYGEEICGLNFVKRGIIVKSNTENGIPKAVLGMLKGNKAVKKIVPIAGDIGDFNYKSIFAITTGTTFKLFKEDIKTVVDSFDMKLIKGKFPEADRKEIVIPLSFAKQNGIAIGDRLGKNAEQNVYLDDDYKVVGIIGGPCSFLITCNTETAISRSKALKGGFIIFLSYDKQRDITTKLKNIGEKNIMVYDYGDIKRQVNEVYKSVDTLKFILDGLIIFVLCISVAHINYVIFLNRKKEFAILNLIGYKKREIYIKILKENVLLNLLAFTAGILAAVLTTVILNITIWEPRGEYTVPFKISYISVTVLVPLFVSIVNMILPLNQIKNEQNYIDL